VRRVNEDSDQAAGQDSFLDVVTNIVGILILLVMVAGLRSSQAALALSTSRPSQSPSKPTITEDEISEAQHAAVETERQVRELLRRAASAHQEAILREQERAILIAVRAEAEQELAKRRAQLNAEDQRDFDLRRQLTEAQLALDELTREQMSLLAQKPEVEEIECQPTPLGRTVTGKEVHILLSDDHVAIVPFDELLELMKQDVAANLWRLRQQDELQRLIGPVNGFRLQYWFVKSAVIARSERGTAIAGQVVRFSQCQFLPVATPVGEPAEVALRSNSEFQRYLRSLRPGTTVTIWTYAGNYERLRQVKRAVREFGLPVAVRPLPKGMPIGASASGSESVSD